MAEKELFEIKNQFVMIEGEHLWTIPDYRNWISRQPYCESNPGPEFTIESCLPIPKLKFRVELIRFNDNYNKVYLKNCGPKAVFINCLELSVLNVLNTVGG
jgi:hypothetical protein